MFPHASVDAALQAEKVVQKLLPLCQTIDEFGARAVIRGSGAKRLIGGTPAGWDTPSHIWKEIVRDTHIQSTAADRLIAGSHDIDIRVSLQPHISFDDLENSVRDNHPEVTKKTFKGMSILEVNFEEFTIDLGIVPNGQESESNMRMGFWMPAKEAFCVAFVGSDGVWSDTFSWDILRSQEFSFTSLYRTDYAGGLIAAQRTLLNEYWWPPQKNLVGYGVAVEQIFSDVRFWKNTKRKYQGIPAERQEEILAGFLLLLTINPMNIHKMMRWHMLDDLPVVKYKEKLKQFAIHELEYQEKFKQGKLHSDESGVICLANYLGVPVTECVALLVQS